MKISICPNSHNHLLNHLGIPMTTFQDAAVAVGARLVTVKGPRVQKMKACRLHTPMDRDRRHLQAYQFQRERGVAVPRQNQHLMRRLQQLQALLLHRHRCSRYP